VETLTPIREGREGKLSNKGEGKRIDRGKDPLTAGGKKSGPTRKRPFWKGKGRCGKKGNRKGGLGKTVSFTADPQKEKEGLAKKVPGHLLPSRGGCRGDRMQKTGKHEREVRNFLNAVQKKERRKKKLGLLPHRKGDPKGREQKKTGRAGQITKKVRPYWPSRWKEVGKKK